MANDALPTEQADALLTLFEQGRYAEAEISARLRIERYPDDAFGWKILGAILAALQRSQEAVASLKKALDLTPTDAEVLNTLGAALEDSGRLEEAGSYYAKAARQAPGFVAAFYNLAKLLQRLGRLEDARFYYEHALKIHPTHRKSLNNLGSLLRDLNRTDEALNCYRQTLALDPNQPQALTNLGNLLLDLGQLDEALDCQRRAIELQPGHPEILCNLGNVLQHLGQLDEALAVYQQSMTILGRPTASRPSQQAKQQLANLLQLDHPEILTMQGNTQQTLGHLDAAEQLYRRALTLDATDASIYSKLLFTLNYHPDHSAETIFEAYREFDRRFGIPHRAAWLPHPNRPDPERRLRLGYVSPDFRGHSACHALEPLLTHHDRAHFELTAYAELAQEDALTAVYRRLVDHWVPTRGLSDDELAARIRADGIDILVDLAGHTANNRLGVFARRPAPVSVTWMGYGSTTGLSAIDYFLADATLVPEGSEALFAEQPWRLDRPLAIHRPVPEMGEVSPLPAHRRGYVTFGTLTRHVRINHRTLRTWSAILQRLPGSRLVIDSKDFAAPSMQQRLAERFEALGIAPERLEIGYHSPPWDVLRGIDIGLDCFPHNSGVTLYETLYMGLPFITLADRPSVGRIGSTILTALGHPEWIATSETDYVERALALAADLDRLAALRAGLRTAMEHSPIRDEGGFVRSLERAYRRMWQLWCRTSTMP
ncbi:tetratricopeptide repeat protein [Allochromatium humboldtianum]|uniref:protein O-GlcNAc transferase n=1 Tax=Allochromatium humboldtianum TaxID=504901 RepID=A0A850RDH3_9GAMM|nr:tetratricopeptide repeat protein [Allochromatium humboldtianum]NVZ10286.1 tetratricopeptide repeat protein [Allochromatium humboldtianum]